MVCFVFNVRTACHTRKFHRIHCVHSRRSTFVSFRSLLCLVFSVRVIKSEFHGNRSHSFRSPKKCFYVYLFGDSRWQRRRRLPLNAPSLQALERIEWTWNGELETGLVCAHTMTYRRYCRHHPVDEMTRLRSHTHVHRALCFNQFHHSNVEHIALLHRTKGIYLCSWIEFKETSIWQRARVVYCYC